MCTAQRGEKRTENIKKMKIFPPTLVLSLSPGQISDVQTKWMHGFFPSGAAIDSQHRLLCRVSFVPFLPKRTAGAQRVEHNFREGLGWKFAKQSEAARGRV